jgi:hypothetical protein
MVGHNLAREIDRLLGADDANELTWHHPALMDELVERVLAICSWLSKINLSGFESKPLPMNVHTLAIALHGYLQQC